VRRGLSADRLSLGAGLVVIGLGALVVLDSSDALGVPPGWMAAALTAALGTVILLSGLAGNGAGRHD
jgi:peptidoglycan/LPS O-acetylase OafA/YrhL